MSNESAQPQTCQNTDRELWRERAGDYYSDSIHVTESGGIGINCGGVVRVNKLSAWHALAQAAQPQRSEQCTCDNASGLHWGDCQLNMKSSTSSEPEFIDEIDECRSEIQAGKRILEAARSDTCGNPACPCVEASSEPPQEWTEEMVKRYLPRTAELTKDINAALAAERERSKELGEDCDHYYDLLVAEREKLKPLVEALKSVRVGADTLKRRAFIDDALAQVKEKK